MYVLFPTINGNVQGFPLLAKQVVQLRSVVGDDDIVIGVVNWVDNLVVDDVEDDADGEVAVEIVDEGADEADSDPTKKVNN